MFVADTPNGNIIEYPANGPNKVVKSGLNSPRGITFTPNGELYIADGFNNRVLLLGSDYKEKLVVGSKGTSDGQLAVPRSILVLPDESILVCDTDNSRLQVFDKAGRFLRKVGSMGSKPLEFKYPLSAALNPTNNNEIAIADSDNNRIQLLDLNFNFIGEIKGALDTVSNRMVDFRTPNSVVYDHLGNLFVSELRGNCIKVFSPERLLIKFLGKDGNGPYELNGPRGITFSPDGSLCVSDHDNNRVSFF